MKTKILTICLILFSLIGYLEWGDNNHQFLFQTEGEVLAKMFTDFKSIVHPFVLLPLIGQLMLTFTLFQKNPSRLFIYIGYGGIALLFFLMLFIGIISSNYKIVISTLPFLITGVITIIHLWKKK